MKKFEVDESVSQVLATSSMPRREEDLNSNNNNNNNGNSSDGDDDDDDLFYLSDSSEITLDDDGLTIDTGDDDDVDGEEGDGACHDSSLAHHLPDLKSQQTPLVQSPANEESTSNVIQYVQPSNHGRTTTGGEEQEGDDEDELSPPMEKNLEHSGGGGGDDDDDDEVAEDEEEIIDVEMEQKMLQQMKMKQEQDEREKKRERQRLEALKEILTTEEKYVQNLRVLEEHFIAPIKESLSSKPHILSFNDYMTFFGDIEVIVNVNKELLNSLKNFFRRNHLLDDGTPPEEGTENKTLGDIFLQMSHYLKSYNTYCNKYESIFKIVEEKKAKSKVFRKWLEKVEFTPEVQFQSLISFMIQPVQRIPRYNLLLRELLKHTPLDSPDYNNLEKANAAVKKVASYVNDRLREQMAQDKVIEIEKLVSSSGYPIELVSPSRKFVMEGPVGYVSHSRGVLTRVMFLFNDMILLVRPMKAQYAQLYLSSGTDVGLMADGNEVADNNGIDEMHCSAEQEHDDTKIVTNMLKKDRKLFQVQSIVPLNTVPTIWIKPLEDNFIMRNGFQIVTHEKIWTLFCRSAEEKKQWIESIDQQMETVRKNTSAIKNQQQAEYEIPEHSLVHQFIDIQSYKSPIATGRRSIDGSRRNSKRKNSVRLSAEGSRDSLTDEKKKKGIIVKVLKKLNKRQRSRSTHSPVMGSEFVGSDSEDDTDGDQATNNQDALSWIRDAKMRYIEHIKHIDHVNLLDRAHPKYADIMHELSSDEFTVVNNPLFGFVRRGRRDTLTDDIRSLVQDQGSDHMDYNEFISQFHGISGMSDIESYDRSSADESGTPERTSKKRKSLFFTLRNKK